MAIKPIYQEWDHERGEMKFTLSPEDFEKVRQGYGCSGCLQDYGGVYLARCPMCGLDTFVAA